MIFAILLFCQFCQVSLEFCDSKAEMRRQKVTSVLHAKTQHLSSTDFQLKFQNRKLASSFFSCAATQTDRQLIERILLVN